MPYHVICFKWGAKYGADYVNRLYGMVARHLSAEFLLHCFTDDASGIRSEVRCHDLPDLGCAVPINVPGMWRKQPSGARISAGLNVLHCSLIWILSLLMT